jgi:general secretion pathway protein K
MKNMRPNKNEKGAVLITTLLLMSVMAVITIAIMDDIRFSIKRSISTQTAEQLSWYSRGGESYAQRWLESQIGDKQENLRRAILLGVPSIFPLEDGELQIRVEDGRNCFNVNAFAEVDKKAETHRQLALLLRFLEFDSVEAETLSSQIQDWIDADSIPAQGGAEDFIYMSLTPAYRAANTVMADITELREIQNIDEETFLRLRPYLCALPTTEFSKINVNTLRQNEAPLLGIVFGVADGLGAAEEVIADRPLAGYDNPDTIYANSAVKGLELKGKGKDQLTTQTDRVDLQIDIKLGDQRRSTQTRFAIGGADGVQLVSRRSRF